MSFSAANDFNVSAGSGISSHGIDGAANGSPANFGNRSILKELNSNDSKIMLSPLAAKTSSLNNSKSLTPSTNSTYTQAPHTPKTPTLNGGEQNAAAAGPAAAATSPAVFEANSTLHKFPVDPELETGLFDEQHHHDLSATDTENITTGVNKSSHKFAGLTEFDEAKIPELPGDLNPNIEEQYNVTFEECFIPTLTANQSHTVPDELAVEKTHLLLPSEVDNTSMSSANETFADCQDDNAEEKDPLAATFSEQPTFNTTTDGDCYQSAIQDDTKEVIADATVEAPQLDVNQTQIIEENSASSSAEDVSEMTKPRTTQTPQAYEDEPMDVDMNATMEIIQNTADQIQNVEKVLQHAENILQHLENRSSIVVTDHKTEEIVEEVKVIGSLARPTETSKMTFVINPANLPTPTPPPTTHDCPSPHLEIEQSQHDVSLNKSIELPLNKSKTISSECVIAAVNNDMTEQQSSSVQTENSELTNELTVAIGQDKNSTLNAMNISASSNSSGKSPKPKTESKLNLTSGLNTSSNSLKSSAPNSPAFPIKQTLNGSSFPKTPKLKLDAQKSTFLEKSDYVIDLENKLKSPINSVNGAFMEPPPAKNRLTFGVEMSDGKDSVKPTEENKRLTFNVQSLDSASLSGMSFPSKDKTENTRRTFCINDVSDKAIEKTETISKQNNDSRRTFNVPCQEQQEATAANVSFEPMDVDDHVEQNITMPVAENIEGKSNSIGLEATEEEIPPPVTIETQDKQSEDLPTLQDGPMATQSPAFPDTEEASPSLTPVSEPLTRSLSPPLPAMQKRSVSPPLPAMQKRSDSPPVPSMQSRSQSPPLPTMQPRPQSPPLPAMQREEIQSSPLPTMQSKQNPYPLPDEEPQSKEQSLPIEEFHIGKQSTFQAASKQQHFTTLGQSHNISTSPPLPNIQKRPPIHGFDADILSAKEQSNIKMKDEKDEMVEKFTPSPMEDMFTTVSATSTTITNSSGLSVFDQSSTASTTEERQVDGDGDGDADDDDFPANNNLILNPSDFDYLLTKGNNNTPVDRSSLLLKFDPLLGVPVPVNSQGQQQQQLPQQQLQQLHQQLHLQIPTNINNNPCLSPTIEEDEHNESTNRSFVVDNDTRPTPPSQLGGGRGIAVATAAGSASALSSSAKLFKDRSQETVKQQQHQHNPQIRRQLPQPGNKKNATMSVDVIKDMSLDNNDCNKTFENSNSTQPDDKQINYKMDEKKIKNEVLKIEDIEKKLKDAEQREEALIKRITEKDKTVAKMNGVIEAYEKAIAELIAEKEQLIQNYEKQLAEVKADRDSNYHHLTSLETTFSDLHVKYEKSKEMTCQLKANEEGLITENRKNVENLRLQEQRYDKMKNHAMQQLEIANKKLECLTREHAMETTKLKALLKKEEIARSSISEQLTQKSKENAELVKICDELISGQGS